MGFVDESSQNINSNSQRVWSFHELKIRKNTAYLKADSIGCYMINGHDSIAFPNHTKSADFCQFLSLVRDNNPQNRICLVLDNFPTHKAKKVKDKASELNIELVYLPPYSPDLNPIEYLWKSIKRIISVSMIESKEELMDIVRRSFFDLTSVFLLQECGYLDSSTIN